MLILYASEEEVVEVVVVAVVEVEVVMVAAAMGGGDLEDLPSLGQVGPFLVVKRTTPQILQQPLNNSNSRMKNQAQVMVGSVQL